MDVDKEESTEKKLIEGDYTQEFYMDRKELSNFLKNLAEEVENGNEISISTEEWELPFKFNDRIEVEIEKEYDELEIEIEFEKYEESEKLSVK